MGRSKPLATVVQIFNQYFVRLDGLLAAGPMMTEALAQEHADRMNNK
jgi:hypothetical protein